MPVAVRHRPAGCGYSSTGIVCKAEPGASRRSRSTSLDPSVAHLDRLRPAGLRQMSASRRPETSALSLVLRSRGRRGWTLRRGLVVEGPDSCKSDRRPGRSRSAGHRPAQAQLGRTGQAARGPGDCVGEQRRARRVNFTVGVSFLLREQGFSICGWHRRVSGKCILPRRRGTRTFRWSRPPAHEPSSPGEAHPQ